MNYVFFFKNAYKLSVRGLIMPGLKSIEHEQQELSLLMYRSKLENLRFKQ